MKNYLGLKMIALSFFLISACTTLESSPKISSNTLVENSNSALISFNPDIPFPTDQAFFPIEPDLSGVYYSWRVCKKKFILCLRWERKQVSFKFNDPEAMRFFKNNDFGFIKRKGP